MNQPNEDTLINTITAQMKRQTKKTTVIQTVKPLSNINTSLFCRSIVFYSIVKQREDIMVFNLTKAAGWFAILGYKNVNEYLIRHVHGNASSEKHHCSVRMSSMRSNVHKSTTILAKITK